jgi:hypothetical protein
LTMLPGDINFTVHYVESRICPAGAEKHVWLSDNGEAGEGLWTHDADVGTDTWGLSGDDYYSLGNAWQVKNNGKVSDLRLVSQQVDLPPEAIDPVISFYDKSYFYRQFGYRGCQTGAVLEYSTDGGAGWIPVPSARILSNPYNGVIEPSDNPLQDNREAWCNLQTWRKTEVDLSGLEGESLNFRFRIGTSQNGYATWTIDDILVSGCIKPNLIHLDGFELP